MAIPPEPIRTPKKRFKLQVRYKNQERDDIVYFSNKPDVMTEPDICSLGLFVVCSEDGIFNCPREEVLSFSIVEE